MTLKPLITDLTYDELKQHIKQSGQPDYRVEQIWVAVYQTLHSGFDQISTLPADLRRELAENFDFNALTPVRSIQSKDGQTTKTLFKLRDNHPIEVVLMRYKDRKTLCISSQSGCGMACSFCATGQMGLRRNLISGEIVDQVLYFSRLLHQEGDSLTNVVVMGMGEPFQNYENVMVALDRLNESNGFGMGARRFTISTVGLVPEIIAFAKEGTQYNLAVSLHSVDDHVRSKLIPINKKYPVERLMEACRYYVQMTNRRVTFEYALIDGVNDSVSDAVALSEKLQGLICHVNLIPLNPTPGFGAVPPDSLSIGAFCETLEMNHISCSIRLRRGVDIQAGCGQLAVEDIEQSGETKGI